MLFLGGGGSVLSAICRSGHDDDDPQRGAKQRAESRERVCVCACATGFWPLLRSTGASVAHLVGNQAPLYTAGSAERSRTPTLVPHYICI